MHKLHISSAGAGFVRTRRTLNTFASVLLISVTLCACTTYVDIPQTKRENPGDNFPKLSAFITEYEKHRVENIQGRRNDEALARNILGIATLGAGLGAGTAAIYDAHRDVVLGFGLAGATAYGASSLFFSPIRTQLLNAANGALACVADTADAVVAAGSDGDVRLKAIATTKDQGTSIDAGIGAIMDGKTEDGLSEQGKVVVENAKKAREDFKALGTRLKATKVNFTSFRGSDALMESRARTAARSIILNLNEELEKAEPSPERIYEMALALGGLSIGFADRAIADTAGRTSDPLVSGGPEALVASNPYSEEDLLKLKSMSAELNAILQASNAQLDGFDASLKAAVNGMGELATKCAFKPVLIADLSLDQESVTVAKDVDIRVRILGGKPPYLANWKVTPPANSVGFSQIGDTIIVSGKSGIDEGEHEIVVTDSLAAKGTATLKVKTLKP